MAQALMNNLNKIENAGLSLKDNSLDSDSINFGKILNSKVFKSNDNKSFDNQEKAISENSADKNDADNTLSKEFNIAIEESCAEIATDLAITENSDLNISANDDIPEEENQQEEISIQPNITEEDPTMLDNLTNLNDSAAVIILHSQQFSPAVNNQADDVTESENCENQNTQNSKEYILDNKNVFKDFENISSKDVQTTFLSSKENPNIKKDSSAINKVVDEKIVKELNVEVVDGENSSKDSSSDDLMQNQTPQEHSIKAMIQSDTKFENTILNIKTIEIKPAEVSSAKIIEQISKQLENMYNNSKLNIVLNPEKLGKVNLQILNGKSGLTAQFTVTTQDARDMLMKGLDGLKESLLAHGVNVDNISVKFEETSENDTNEDWTEQKGSRGGNKHQETGKQKENEKTFEELIGMDLEKNNSDS